MILIEDENLGEKDGDENRVAKEAVGGKAVMNPADSKNDEGARNDGGDEFGPLNKEKFRRVGKKSQKGLTEGDD